MKDERKHILIIKEMKKRSVRQGISIFVKPKIYRDGFKGEYHYIISSVNGRRHRPFDENELIISPTGKEFPKSYTSRDKYKCPFEAFFSAYKFILKYDIRSNENRPKFTVGPLVIKFFREK